MAAYRLLRIRADCRNWRANILRRKVSKKGLEEIRYDDMIHQALLPNFFFVLYFIESHDLSNMNIHYTSYACWKLSMCTMNQLVLTLWSKTCVAKQMLNITNYNKNVYFFYLQISFCYLQSIKWNIADFDIVTETLIRILQINEFKKNFEGSDDNNSDDV